MLLDSGANPKVTQRQLRHADAVTTLEVYGHILGDAHREAVEKVANQVGAVLEGNGGKRATIN
jgi:integrase